jgi:hypothetical protein
MRLQPLAATNQPRSSACTAISTRNWSVPDRAGAVQRGRAPFSRTISWLQSNW